MAGMPIAVTEVSAAGAKGFRRAAHSHSCAPAQAQRSQAEGGRRHELVVVGQVGGTVEDEAGIPAVHLDHRLPYTAAVPRILVGVLLVVVHGLRHAGEEQQLGPLNGGQGGAQVPSEGRNRVAGGRSGSRQVGEEASD